MSAEDKIKNATQNLTGKAEEAAGHVTGSDRLVAEGKVDQASAKAKKTVEDVKDAVKGEK